MSLSTHVLDATTGRPAEGVAVASRSGSTASGARPREARTDADGRIGDARRSRRAGIHRLRFDTGGYFAAAGVATFYPEVTVTFTVDRRRRPSPRAAAAQPVRVLDLSRAAEVVSTNRGGRRLRDRHRRRGRHRAPTRARGGQRRADRRRRRRARAPPIDGARRVDGARLPGDAGLRQHPPPPLPVADPRLRPRRHAVRVADRRSTRCGPTSTPTSSTPPPARDWPRWPCRAARRRWTITTCSRESGGDLLAAEIEAARRIGLRFCATRGAMNLGRSSGGLPPDEVVERCRTRSSPNVQPRSPAYHDAELRLDAPDRARALLAVLGHGGADARLRRARPLARRPPAHPPRRDPRRGGVLPGALRRAAGRLRRVAGLARRRRVAGALRPPLRRRHRPVRRDRHRRRALPELERAAGLRHRADPGAARRRAPRSVWGSTASRPTSTAGWPRSCTRRC